MTPLTFMTLEQNEYTMNLGLDDPGSTCEILKVLVFKGGVRSLSLLLLAKLCVDWEHCTSARLSGFCLGTDLTLKLCILCVTQRSQAVHKNWSCPLYTVQQFYASIILMALSRSYWCQPALVSADCSCMTPNRPSCC